MRQLIVNADDFGYTRGVNRAILEACRKGVVTSTSLLANGDAFEDAVESAISEPGLDIGCHLNFIEGKPISPPEGIPHLIDRDGQFLRAGQLAVRLTLGGVPESEIEREAGAQIEKLLRAGVRVSHVDTHKHTHTHPVVARAVARAAQRCGIGWIRRPFENFHPGSAGKVSAKRLLVGALNLLGPSFERRMGAMGLAMPDYFTGIVVTGRLTRAEFAAALASLPEGTTEVMCHPGYCDPDLKKASTRLQRERELERETVSDETWRAVLRERGIRLTSFGELSSRKDSVAKDTWPAIAEPALRD